MKHLFFIIAALSCSILYAQTNLISYGSNWKYLDNGTNQGTAWRAKAFNDASWVSGNAQLGYGDGDEATVVSYGPSATNKYITTYFRKTISVTNTSAFTSFTINLKRDDGAVVYINGTQRFRSNMPAGNISYTTKASTDAADDGNTAQTITIPTSSLVNGSNVIAVEIHQRTANSTDISFDLELIGNGDVTPPVVNSFAPADNSTNVTSSSNLTLNFNETVQKGTGSILIKESGIITQTIDVTSASVTVAGNIVTIDPADFGNGAAINIEIAAGAFKDLANNNYAGIANATAWNFGILLTDIISPTVTNYSPADDAINVAGNSNLILTFDEVIQKGTGAILIKEGGIITQTIDVSSVAVTVAGNIVTIDPADFGNGAAVNIEIAAGAFKDLANNNHSGITNATIWNFDILFTDITPPTAINYSPADDATDVATNSNLVITFNEPVQNGTGIILVKEGGIITQTIDVASLAVTVVGNTVTINPADFGNGATVSIEIADGAFKDLANNNYAGITDSSTWSFDVLFTDITPPAVINYSPADDAVNVSANSNLILIFSEPVQKGTGAILIKESGVITQTIDVNAPTVTVSGNIVTIDAGDFGYSAAVNIEIAAGAFNDLANNNYAGITNASSWNFNTEAAPSGPQTLVAYGASWKYLDNGTNQGTIWKETGFDDASWVSGNAQLGYGDGDETTVVSYGPDANNKYITTYFRKTISVINPAALSTITGNVKRDDGIVLYVNGTEVYRNNMPTGSIAYSTLASTAASDDGATAQPFTISPSVFASGTNIIAAEIHQSSVTSTDLSFDLEIIGTVDITAPTVTAYSPLDNASNVAINSDLIITFDETVQKGSGNILIKEGGIVTQTIDVTSAAVLVAGNTVTIDPANFTNSSAVNIEIAAGVFKDLATNNYTGIVDATTWNFSIADADLISPVTTAYSPLDNSTNVAVSSNLVLTFSETVQKGIGNIVVKEAGVITQTIDINSGSVTVTGNIVTINPSDFGYTAAVNIEITAGAFTDLANNNYAGIADAGTWNFNTEDLITGPQTFIPYGASWKYLDNGTNQGTTWRGTGFDDASWVSGNAQLGYGDGDEATVVSYGPNANAKYITTYFRKTISISNPLAFSTFTGNVKRDDGIVLYVNGTEVYRNNMPTTTITYTTLASTAASDDGNTAQVFTISSSAFTNGNNVIAVEIHQNSATSSDLSFDLQLTGNVAGAALLTRGPYLNMGNQTEVTLRWRTDVATNGKVELGTTFGSYPIVVNDGTATIEHEIRVTGLVPDTKYYYRFGSSSQVLQTAIDNNFTTAPAATTTRKLRFAAFGDCGRNDNGFQAGSLNSYLSYVGANPAEALLLLGDNAYESGLDNEYQTSYFDVYSSNVLKNHQLFPAPGNHDYANSTTKQADHNIPYYSIFTNPNNAQCGGVASGTEAYYSWDWGNVHFLSLDSYGKENSGTTRLYDTLGAQAVWVKQDLAANTKPWVIAYWHHPPYTMGSHNSDTESELINMRQNFTRILERMGVDLILCGHSHDYERSYLLNGHYGTEATFNVNTHALSSSSGKYDGTANSCTYTTVNGQNHGTVYVVSGSAGADGGVQAGYPHNAMPWSVDDGGVLYFEVEDNRLDAKFIRRTGTISDQFTIMKNVNKTTNLSIAPGTPTQLTASWVGNYSWSTGETTRTITVSPTINTVYTVADANSCVTDIFNISITAGRAAFEFFTEKMVTDPVPAGKVLPTFAKRGEPILVRPGNIEPTEAIISDMNGRIIHSQKFSDNLVIQTSKFHAGIYYIKLSSKLKTETFKFIIMD